MAQAKININTDIETKELAQKLFANLGMDMTTAINVFLKKSIQYNGIPFDVRLEIPNAETLAAFEEVKEMEAHPEKYPSYKSIEELRAALDV